jgi:hypothetical protein
MATANEEVVRLRTDLVLQVTLKPEASHEDFEKAKKDVESKGGKITHEFKLIKGFTYVLTACAMSPSVNTN